MMIGKGRSQKAHQPRFHSTALVCLFTGFLILLCFLRPTFGGEGEQVLGFQPGKESDSLPEGWEYLTYSRTAENEISLLEEEKATVLHVKSLGSASAILKRVDVDMREFPVLTWRWKVNRVVGMAIESERDRNDSAARVRVIFGRAGEKPPALPPEIQEFLKSLGIERTGREPSGFKIDYIWANRAPKGKTFDYPGSRNHKIVVVESGKEMANRWVSEKRNLIEDFEELFQAAPPGLSGVVILTDTDQTNEGVEAWYSNVVLMSQ